MSYAPLQNIREPRSPWPVASPAVRNGEDGTEYHREGHVMSKILFVVGSKHRNGFNQQLADEARKLIGDRAEVSFLDFSAVPFFDQDQEFPAPASVNEVCKAVVLADGVWFFSPEYNYSYTGYLKNLLDWLSRPLEPFPAASSSVLAGKKVAISAVAGPRSAGAGSLAKLAEVLSYQSELLPEQTGVGLAPEAFGTGDLGLSDEDRAKLSAEADAFLKFIA